MPIVRRGAPLVLVRRGMGQNTMVSQTNLPAFCAALPPANAAAYPACAALPVATIQAAVGQTPGGIIATLAAKNAPPVYVSSFTPSSNSSDWTQPSYAVNNTAAGVASQVNDQNGRLYQNYQNALQNWAMAGSVGSPPAPPQYVTFNDYWSQQNLGPAPGSISQAPAGTPIPSSGFLTGALAPGGAGLPMAAGPLMPRPTQTPGPSVVVQSNAPSPTPVPSPSPQAQSNAPSPTVAPPSSGILQTLQNIASQVTGGGTTTGTTPASNWFDGIPNWALLAAAGLGVFLLWPRGNR